MKIWLHRISHCAEASYPLLDRGYLTIGFSDFSDPEFITNLSTRSQDESWRYFDGRFQSDWGFRPKGSFSLWKFVREMRAGDQVLVPKQGVFSVYEITEDVPLRISEVETTGLKIWGLAEGDSLVVKNDRLTRVDRTLDTNKPFDLGFARRVRPIQTDIPRASFADAALTSRMKIRITTSDISNLQESVDRSVGLHRSGRPADIHATLLETHTESTLHAIKRDLDDIKFEKLIKWYFEKVGAKVERPSKNESGKEGDGDIVATFDALRTIIYVQAKAHHGKTNQWAAEQIIGYRDQKQTHATESGMMDDGYARIAWVVSTADDFTAECIALAKDNKVLLLNGRDFVKLMLNAGIEGLDLAF